MPPTWTYPVAYILIGLATTIYLAWDLARHGARPDRLGDLWRGAIWPLFWAVRAYDAIVGRLRWRRHRRYIARRDAARAKARKAAGR
jgi:hypothetical protein